MLKLSGSKELEDAVDLSIAVSKERGSTPSRFIMMRNELGTIAAICKCVESSEPNVGLRKAKRIGILEHSLESIVMRFKAEFPEKTVAYADCRLKMISNP